MKKGMQKTITPKMIVPDDENKVIHLLWQDNSRFFDTSISGMKDPKEKDMRIIRRICEHLHAATLTYQNEWIGVFLMGSQNYGLDTPESDIDTTVIVLPTLEDMIAAKAPLSKTITFDNGEHCEVKDIRLMLQIFKKQNISALEILATKWKVMNPAFEHEFSALFDNVERIARYDNYRFVDNIWHIMKRTHSLMCKPTPAREEVVATFGYDGKCLCTLDRQYEFFCRFMLEGESFKESLVSKKTDLMLAAKAQRYTLDCAKATADNLLADMTTGRAEYVANNSRFVDSWIDVLLDSVLEAIMLKHMKRELQDREEE